MARHIALTDSKSRRVIIKSASARRIPLIDVGKKLGAKMNDAKLGRTGSPTAFAAVREEIFQRLKSTGGRPGLAGTEPKKIPLTKGEWKKVEQVAHHISEPGFNPSVGQVASVLLSIVLRNVDSSIEAAVKRSLKAEDA